MLVRTVLPADPGLGHPEQEVVSRLWMRRQTETGWVCLVGLPSYLDLEDGGVEAAEYRVWVRRREAGRRSEGVQQPVGVHEERVGAGAQSTTAHPVPP